MNNIQTALSSARFNRILLAFGVLVLAAGAMTLVFKLAGGSDNTPVNPSAGFKPTLPVKTTPLRNSQGTTVRTFEQLDPQVRSTIRTFLDTVVPRRNIGRSWAVVAPEVKAGYTYKKWTHANALPVNFYPVDNVDTAKYYLDEANTQDILIDVGLSAPAKFGMRPTTFQLGLVPVGKGAKARWLVNYFMPRWTPPIPVN